MGHFQSFVLLLGRLAIAYIFIFSGITKIFSWGPTLEFMSQNGMKTVEIFLIASICIEILAGLSLVLGWHMTLGAMILLLYLIPVTLTFHSFWQFTDPQVRALQMWMFNKNLAIFGGLLVLTIAPAGKYSVDKT
jgi:putative oxidoreductase